MYLFSICLLSNFLTRKNAWQCHEPSLYQTCFLGADCLSLFFFFFLLLFPSIFVKPWRAAPENVPLLGRCPRAAILRHPPRLQHRGMALLCCTHCCFCSVLPTGNPFKSYLWLLAVETVLKAGVFFFLWTPSVGWQWQICSCWVSFSVPSGIRWLMWRMLYGWLTITLAQQSAGTCRGSAAGSKEGSQPFFPANAPVKMEIILYFIGLKLPSLTPSPAEQLPSSLQRWGQMQSSNFWTGLADTDLIEVFCWASGPYL